MRAFGDIQWTSPDRLKELLRTSGGLRAPAVSAKWIRGQLEFYNIFYETNWGDEELADALETAVRDGNVSSSCLASIFSPRSDAICTVQDFNTC